MNVKYIGTVGILMLAYDKGCIGQAEEKVIAIHIRLDKKICNVVMAHIGLDERY